MTKTALRAWCERVGDLVNAVVGAPSYDRYVAHLRTAYPDRVPLEREEFTRQRLEARYSKPARCC